METIENRIRQIIREELQPLIEALRGVAEDIRDTSQPSSAAADDASHRTVATRPRDSSRHAPGKHDGWITPAEAAALLRLSPKTLANWRSQKIGPVHHKVGRVVRYRRHDVECYGATIS